MKDFRVREIPSRFADLDLLIVTLVLDDDAELRRRVLLPERDSGFRDTAAALAWNSMVRDRPAVRAEWKIENSSHQPEATARRILERIGPGPG